LWPAATISDAFTFALLGFQLAGFMIVGGLVVGRDRRSLSDAENRAVFRVSLSLLLIFPFLVSDYRLWAPPTPVRLSGLAILVVCWLSLSLWRPKLNHGLYVAILALYLVVAGSAAAIMAWQFSFGWVESLQAGAIILALLLLAAIIRDDLHLREEATQNAVLSEIGRAEISSLATYLGDLAPRGVLDGVLLLAESDLVEFDCAAAAEHFRGRSAVSVMDLPAHAGNDTLSQSQLRALFDRYAATHLFAVSHEPLQIAAVRQPGFATSEVDGNLSAAFGLARLISERDRLRAELELREGTTT